MFSPNIFLGSSKRCRFLYCEACIW